VLFVRHESTLQYSGIVEDLAPYRIGVVSQTSYGLLFDNAVREKKLLKLDEARDFISNFKKLLAGRVDMVINSYDVGMALVNELQQQDNVKVLDPPVENVESYLAFTRQRNFQQLADDFDNVLQQMIADGTVENIKRRYPAAVSIGY
jgi:polar amino acid transport system substrate-binding protein